MTALPIPPDTADPARRSSPAVLREARRHLQDGADANAHDERLGPLLGPLLARSWQRSHHAGLAPQGRRSGTPHASAAQLARALERQYELLSHARPVLDDVAQYLCHSDSVLLLADAQGMVLQKLGDTSFASRAEGVALRPGANWSECWRGTNAIGTALIEGRPLVVHGGEHYLERNGFLTCAAAPIVDPAGRLLGAIDITGEQPAWQPTSLGHTLGLAGAAARMVEHRLFDTWHGAGLRLRLHAQAEGIGTFGEGLVALADDGTLIGANSSALAALGVVRQALGKRSIADLLGLGLPALLARIGQPAQPLHLPAGPCLWLRVESGRAGEHSVAVTARPPGSTPAAASPLPKLPAATDALAQLDTGDPTLRAAIDRARRVADKPIALLLQGESGVGKEVFARALHASGPRRGAAFVALNCAALPETLFESELFGYQGGAFTGARREGAPGRVREANGGTLFLDGIGDMPLTMQARLLRVLQERAVLPLGGGKAVAVDFGLVCATHRNLRQAMAEGRFREDLYYRINGLTLHLPPLRERADLAGLVAQMLADAAPDRTLPLVLSAELQRAFAAYRWPGNLRQLANALRTAAALLPEGCQHIDWPHLPDDLAADLRATLAAPIPQPVLDQEANLRLQQDHTVQRVLDTCGGNLSEAARRLGISRNTLYRRLRERATS